MRSKLGLILLAAAAVMILATTYLALFYAPIPQTSVGSAGEVLSTIEGSRIRVAGFVVDYRVYVPPGLDSPTQYYFSLSDFSDYLRYLEAVREGNLDGAWWTIRPIDVALGGGGLVYGGGPHLTGVRNGTNVSVDAIVRAGEVGGNSEVTGFYLAPGTAENVEVGYSAGQFEVMTAPVAQKIFYFHMPAAWVSYLGFFVTLAGGALYLKTRDMKFDRLAHSSAELGVLFATIAILTGPVWAKEEWGVYWRWSDMKLVTTFILWLVYIGYLSLRAAISEPSTRARVSSVYGILGFVTVPMSLLSSRIAPLLSSSHPQVIASSSGGLSPEAGITIGVAVVAFTFLFAAMLIKRFEVAEAEEELEELKKEIGGE